MVKEFLKIAGVKNQSDFYKKYPTEEAFFKAHPEAMQMMKQKPKMSYGGGMYAYDIGGEPVSSDYPDYRSFKAAYDAWENSQNMPITDGSLAYTLPAAGPTGLPDYLTAQEAYGAVAPQAAAAQRVMLNPYEGVSVQDMLAAQGLPADYASRKQLAKILKIQGYRGTPGQNRQMMEMIRQNPDILASYSGSVQPSAAPITAAPVAMSAGPQYVSLRDEFTNPPDGYGSPVAPQQEVMQDEDGNFIIPAAAITGATGAALYGMNKYANSKYGKWTEADIYINRALKEGRTSDLFDILKNKFKMPVTEINKRLKGANFYKPGQNVTGVTEGVAILKEETAKKAAEIVSKMREQGFRNPKLVAQLDKLTGSPIESAKLMKGIPLSAKTAKTAQAVKTAEAAKAVEALGLGSRMAEGLRALSEMKYIKPIVQFGRGALETFHEYGGQPGYQAGGSYNPTFVDYGSSLPMFNMGASMPQAMYGLGMANGGSHYNYGGTYAKGGIVKGGEYDMSEDEIQDLINQGYKIEYI